MIGWTDLDSHAPLVLPIDRLGQPLPLVTDWSEAEEALEEKGLALLTGKFSYTTSEGTVSPVRIAQIYENRIVFSTGFTDAIEEQARKFTIPFPPPGELKALD